MYIFMQRRERLHVTASVCRSMFYFFYFRHQGYRAIPNIGSNHMPYTTYIFDNDIFLFAQPYWHKTYTTLNTNFGLDNILQIVKLRILYCNFFYSVAKLILYILPIIYFLLSSFQNYSMIFTLFLLYIIYIMKRL